MTRVLCIVAALFLIAQTLALGASLATVNVTVVNDTGQPVQSASVSLNSPSGTFTANTDDAGKASFNVPPDQYTVVVEMRGFSMKTVTVQASLDGAQDTTVQLRRTSGERARPVPPPVEKPGEAMVRDAVVSGYNKSRPEHKRGTPYFGRYTYVLLRDNSSRSQALLAALVQQFSSDGSIAVGPPTDMDNPWGYNVFLLPLKNQRIASGALNAKSVLRYYDFSASKNLRDRYCAITKHARYSLCKAPYDGGPVLLTFLRPIGELKRTDPLPPALAYDFSGVPEAQFTVTVTKLQQTVAVAAPVQSDTLLPPPVLSRYVAPLLANITSALTNVLPKLRLFHDGGILP